jgi:hypothetical protein
MNIDMSRVKEGLSRFPDEVAKKVLRGGTFAGAKLVRDRVKHGAPIRREGIKGKYYGRSGDSRIRYPGFLKRMIGAKYSREKSNKWQVVYNTKPMGAAFYGFFVEGGHRVGRRPSKARIRVGMDNRGWVQAHPFMEPVFRNAANEAVARMKTTMETGIVREWKNTVNRELF